jgi:membrane protease YdiL (CAAX protease family)
VAFLLPPALMLLAVGLHSLLTRTPPDFNQFFGREIFGPGISPPVLFLPFLLFSMLTNGEEIGWRGFALPRLQQRHTALVASLILGAVWAFWHLPKYLMVNTSLGGGSALGEFPIESAHTLAFAILYTWLFNNTRGSLLLLTIFHASWNAAWVSLPMQNVSWASLVVYWLAALVVILLAGPAELVRKEKGPSAAAARPV